MDEYLAYGPQHGFNLNLMPDALFFALQAAYIAYDGEHLEPSFAGQTEVLLMKGIAAKPAMATMNDQTRQAINDQFGILGMAMLLEIDKAQRTHNSEDIRETRAFAERFIKVFGGIDPKRTRINQLICYAVPGPCELMQYLISAGRVGRFQLVPGISH